MASLKTSILHTSSFNRQCPYASPLEQVPYEICQHIFSFLDFPSHLSTVLVNRNWRQLALKCFQEKTGISFQKFAQHLSASSLDQLLKEKTTDCDQTDVDTPLDPMQDLSITDLNNIDFSLQVSQPLINLAYCYYLIKKELNSFYTNTYNPSNLDNLVHHCKILVDLGKMQKAIEIALQFPVSEIKSRILAICVESLINKPQMDKAIEVAKKMPLCDGTVVFYEQVVLVLLDKNYKLEAIALIYALLNLKIMNDEKIPKNIYLILCSSLKVIIAKLEKLGFTNLVKVFTEKIIFLENLC